MLNWAKRLLASASYSPYKDGDDVNLPVKTLQRAIQMSSHWFEILYHVVQENKHCMCVFVWVLSTFSFVASQERFLRVSQATWVSCSLVNTPDVLWKSVLIRWDKPDLYEDTTAQTNRNYCAHCGCLPPRRLAKYAKWSPTLALRFPVKLHVPRIVV